MPVRKSLNPTRARYTYTCSTCTEDDGRPLQIERTVPFAARDEQLCETCRAPLVRAPIETTAHTPYSWK